MSILSDRALISSGTDAGRYTNIGDDNGDFEINGFKTFCCASAVTCPRYTDRRPITPNATEDPTMSKFYD